jgi:hypothetical protein
LDPQRAEAIIEKVGAQPKYMGAAARQSILAVHLQGVEEFLKDRFNISEQSPDRDVPTLSNLKT